jgi:hypothetical protein
MRQRIWQAIADFEKWNRRHAGLRELAHEVGIASTGHLRYHLYRMEEEGIIKMTGGRQGIFLRRQPPP